MNINEKGSGRKRHQTSEARIRVWGYGFVIWGYTDSLNLKNGHSGVVGFVCVRACIYIYDKSIQKNSYYKRKTI